MATPPPGFHTVTPRMFVDDVARATGFLRTVFGATGDAPPDRPVDMRVGDSVVMVSSSEARSRFPAFLYIYVDDVDATYRRALAEGATSIEEPADQTYGDRRAMVRDPSGNIYQIAHHRLDHDGK
jgi:uncharacterized glyoxalase superfamily protein PhnB